MSRLLGVDLGERRIGIAVADTDSAIVRRLGVLRRASPERDGRNLATLCREQHIDEIVVGLPLHANGDEGEQAEATRAWAAQVTLGLGIPVRWRDERWTSVRAEEALGPLGRGRDGGPPSEHARRAFRATIDQEAAALILEAELEARRARAVPGV